MADVREAEPIDADAVAWLAAVTFPAACPPSLSRDDVADFIEAELSPQRFRERIASPAASVLVLGDLRGYALVEFGAHDHGPEQWRDEESAYLSKLYLRRSERGGDGARALMRAVVDAAEARGCVGVWLGVNSENLRAQRFYAKNGFAEVGRRSFAVGGEVFDDAVLARPLR